MTDIRFAVDVKESDWDPLRVGWRCEALRIPGSSIRLARPTGGGELLHTDDDIKADKGFILWLKEVDAKPTGLSVEIRLTKDLEQIEDVKLKLERSKHRLNIALGLASIVGPVLGWVANTYFKPHASDVPPVSSAVSTSPPPTASTGADRERAAPATIVSRRGKDASGAGDYLRVFFMPQEQSLSDRLGRSEARRVFVVPTEYFQPALNIGRAAALLGNEYRNDEDIVVMRCRPSDPRILDARSATWYSLFKIMDEELSEIGVDCSGPQLSSRDTVLCGGRRMLHASSNTDATVLIGEMYDSARKLRADDREGYIDRLYSIKKSFAGVGYSVEGTGRKDRAYTQPEILDGLIVLEQLVRNEKRTTANCRCVRARPYSERQNDLLVPDSVWDRGNAECKLMDRL